jgi:hypothetical protein
VILNLWFDLVQELHGSVFQELNPRATARNLRSISASAVQIRRATTADEAMRMAFEEQLPVRVITNDGERRRELTPGASKVRSRQLDPVVWHIGPCIGTRGCCSWPPRSSLC